jgi:hypothetical protein
MRVTESLAAIAVLFAPTTGAIETDQFYTWGRELADATAVLDAKVNAEMLNELERINSTRSWNRHACEDVARRIERHFRLFIYHDLQLWADNSSLLERIPATKQEERLYRKRYIYRNRGPFDVGTWIPPSPTVSLNGVRIGTDKLTHFFSEGWMSYQWYAEGLEQGLSAVEAEKRAVRRGILLERSVLGMAASGVFSLADLEANYQGMVFFREMCQDVDPLLIRDATGWHLSRPFEFRHFVTPEWDESYQPSVFGKRRWKKVRPVMLEYCPLLDDPQVARMRADYAARDSVTFTERIVEELVEEEKLQEPSRFTIDQLCSSER